MCGFAFCFRTSSTAEDPRRHVGHVGESSRTTRTSPDAALNAVRSWSKFADVSDTNGGCPAGTFSPPLKCQPRASSPMITTARILRRGFTVACLKYPQAHWQRLEEREEEELQRLSPDRDRRLRS